MAYFKLQKKQAICTAITLKYKMLDEQSTKVLKDLNLEDRIPRSLQENINLDIINKLSMDKFRTLWLANRSDIVKL